MTTSHTPGPWVAVELPTAIAIKSHMGNVANIQRGSMREQQQANARLIAAAPDLLEALKAFVNHGSCFDDDDMEKARAAIAKVQGGEA